MKFINANKLHRKSGGMGHPSLVWEREPLRLSSQVGSYADSLALVRICRHGRQEWRIVYK